MVKPVVSYVRLVEKLAAIGVNESEANPRYRSAEADSLERFWFSALLRWGVTALRLED